MDAKAEEVKKLLDNGHTVVLRRSGMGGYLAVAVRDGTEAGGKLDHVVDVCLGLAEVYGDYGENLEGVVETDDFNIADLLYRITEKATTGRIA